MILVNLISIFITVRNHKIFYFVVCILDCYGLKVFDNIPEYLFRIKKTDLSDNPEKGKM